MRVTFQFLARVLRTFRSIPGLTTVIGRSFQGLVERRTVLAGVAETSFKKSVLDLKLSLAVGPIILHIFTRKESALHHFRIDLDTVWKSRFLNKKNDHFARITFQFLDGVPCVPSADSKFDNSYRQVFLRPSWPKSGLGWRARNLFQKITFRP